MGKKRFKANTEILPSNYDDFFNKVYQNGNKYKDLSDNVFDKTETRRLDFDSHNQDELTGNENPFTSQFGNPNAEDPYNEYRANNQSSAEQAGLGLARAGAKAATEVAKLPGVIGGIGIMAADGLTGGNLVAENEGFETAFNNQWIKFFDGLNEDVKEALPVYVKESVANGDFFDKIGSSAFYATEGADGAGYMLGALAPGGLFKYFGGAGKLFGASIKAAKLAKYGENIQAAGKFLEKAGITIKNIDQYMIPAFNTVSEAGAESKGVWDGMESRKDGAHVEYMSKLKPNDPRYLQAISLKNEELDQLRRSGEISIDEYNQQSANVHSVVAEEMFEKDFKEQKALAAQNSFFKNVVVLAGPNYIQAKLLFGKTPSKVLLDKIGGLGEKSIKNTFKQGAKNFVKGFASEGVEEVGQTAIEHRNTEQGLKFKLGDNRIDDYNPLTFGEDFVKTLGTTEGQIAGFLGGIMGAPMSTVGGYFQDKSDRKQTERLREKINGASTAYADIKNTNIYEQEEYTNPETGEVSTRDKEVDGKKVFIPEAVAKVKKALDLIEKDSNEYDNAIEDGDVERIEQFRNQGELNVINNFIGEDEVTLDALHEYLKIAFPTETSKDISVEQVKVNKENTERVNKIMNKAKSLQKDLTSYKDMAASLIRINNPEVTPEHLSDFMNRVANTFISERAEEFDAKDKLVTLQKQKADLESNSSIIEIDNPNFIEGTTENIFKTIKARNNNPRLDLVNSQIAKVEKQLKDFEEATNSTIWDNEYLNNKINNEVKVRQKLQKENSPEQVAKNDEVLDKTKNATTVDEVKEIEKTSPKEVLENPIIKTAIVDKKSEIIQVELAQKIEIIREATQEDNDFNDTTVYTDLTGTEGSPVTDNLIPKEAENNTVEELKTIDNEEVLTGKGAQVISTNMKTGELFNFVSEDYLNYERNPINKTGKEVGFEINTNPGANKNLNIALKMLEDKDFSNPAFLISYLPINVTFEKGIKAPMETRRANGKLDSKKDKDGKDQFYINPATEILRSQIINHLVNGGSINDIKTTIQDQYKGLLKVDENRFANNNILELDGVKDLKYVRDNLYVVDSFGNLMNIQSGKTKTFSNGKTKKNAAGEIYLSIPQANGKPFPLKLNIKKINESEAVLLYEIYKEIITNDNTLNTTVSEVNPELQEAILTSFNAELDIIGGNKNDIKLQEIVDLLIYQSDNVKSRMQVEKNDKGETILLFGENEADISNIEDSQNAIINYLVDSKRHQIKINPKFATDNTKTNLKSNNADYLKYLIDNGILTTNAVVNEPTFQGYTNIYLNTGVTVTNQVKSIEKVENVSSEIDNIEKRRLKEINTHYRKSDLEDFKVYNGVSVETGQGSFSFKIIISKEKGVKKGSFNDNSYAQLSIDTRQTNKSFPVDTINQVIIDDLIEVLKNDPVVKRVNVGKTNVIERYSYPEVISEINQRYDNEIALLQKNISPSDKIIFGHPGIGKTYLKESGRTDVIDFDSDYKSKINIKFGLKEGFKARNDFQKNNKEKYQKTVRELWNEAKQESVKTGKQLFASDMILLREFPNDFDKVITMSKETFVDRAKQRNDYTNGETESWKNNLDIEIAKINKSKIIETNKYLSELVSLNQPKVSESGVEVSADNTGFDEMFNTSEMGDDVLDILKEFETETKVENKSENIRNVQESFVSLSEIKGTVGNTQLNETQAEVFNENRKPLSATEQRLINKAISVYQEDASKLTEAQKRRLEEYATNYPESWKKICK